MSVSLDDLVTELEWRKCAPDWDTSTVEQRAQAFEYFCDNYWLITVPPKGKTPFIMFDAQRDTVRGWLGNRYTVVLKARQIGYTTLVAAYCFWLAFFYDDRPIIIVSKTQEHAKLPLQKIKYGYRFLPEWMRLRGPHVVGDSQTELMFGNASSISSLPSASEPGRGMTTFLSVIDEIGFLPNSAEAYAAIEPTAEIGGSLIMLGTANGEGNLLHKLWLGSQGMTLEYSQYHGMFKAWDANGRDDAWYQAKAASMPEWQMHQEYPRDPEEAFLKSGRPIFNLDAVRSNPVQQPRVKGRLRENPYGGGIELLEDGGPLSVWEAPQDKHLYVIGADVAEGLEHGDFSVASVIDVKTNEVVAVWHGHIEPDLFGSDVLTLLGKWYNRALLGVEVNNHGLTTLVALKATAYPNLYYQTRKGQRWEQKTEMLGWRTTMASKPLAIDELDLSMRGGPAIVDEPDVVAEYVRPPDALTIYDEGTISELKTYTRDERGRMSGSPFDDRVMALAIANQMVQYVYEPHYRMDKAKTSMGYVGIAGVGGGVPIEGLLKQDSSPDRVPLGAHSTSAKGRARKPGAYTARIRL